MKALFLLVVLLCGCVNKGNFEPEPRIREDLTEQEITSLHSGITVTEISRRTNLQRFSEWAIPVFMIQIKDQPKMQCGILFDEKSGRILCAVKSDYIYGTTNDVVFLWPQELAGQRATEADMIKISEQK